MAKMKNIKKINWLKKRQRIKKNLSNKTGLHRLVVFRSNSHIYAQVIDDLNDKTIVSSSTNDRDIQKELSKCAGKVEKSTLVGKHLGKKMKEKKIDSIIFDRNGYNYHGRIKALAEAVRGIGVKF